MRGPGVGQMRVLDMTSPLMKRVIFGLMLVTMVGGMLAQMIA